MGAYFILASIIVFGALVGIIVGIVLARHPATTRFRSMLKGTAVGVATMTLFVFVAVLVISFQFNWFADAITRYEEGKRY